METIRFRLQTYEIKMETDWFKLVQIGLSLKNHGSDMAGTHIHQAC